MTMVDLGADGPHDEASAGSVELDLTGEDGSVAGGPMVGIAIRLPVATLDAARVIAQGEGVKVTAMLRDWIDQRVAERVDDERVVSVADLRRLIVHRAHDLQMVPAVSGGEPSAGEGELARKPASGGTKPKAKGASGRKSKGKASGGSKSKAKPSGHGASKA